MFLVVEGGLVHPGWQESWRVDRMGPETISAGHVRVQWSKITTFLWGMFGVSSTRRKTAHGLLFD